MKCWSTIFHSYQTSWVKPPKGASERRIVGGGAVMNVIKLAFPVSEEGPCIATHYYYRDGTLGISVAGPPPLPAGLEDTPGKDRSGTE